MILGESPYRDRPLTPEFTTQVVQDVMGGSGDPSLNFFAKTVGSFSEAGKTSSVGEISYVLSLSTTSFKTLSLVRKFDLLGKCGLARFLHSQKYSKSWNRNLFLSSHETSGIKYLPFPKAHLLAFPVAKPRRVDSTNCLTFLEFLLPDQSPKQRWLELQKLVSLRESRNPRSHQCFFDRDTQDRKHMLWLVRGALGPLHRATAFDREQECCSLHLSGNLQDG